MDQLGLMTLRDELRQDCRVASEAAHLAQKRFEEQTEAGLEACAHHLMRFYNVVERSALRVAKAFENHIDDGRGWHTELIQRLCLPIQSVRPALINEALRQPLRELRGFRHVIMHAYDLELDREKVALVLKYARKVEPELAPMCQEFIRQVAQQEGWTDFV
jgi:hypothetical protein